MTPLFKNTIKFVKMKVNHSNSAPRKTNLIAHNFQRAVLDGTDFSSSLLIAASYLNRTILHKKSHFQNDTITGIS